MVIGLDIGFGQTKVVFGDESVRQDVFPTLLAHYVSAGPSDEKVIEYEGKEYVVGEGAKAFESKIAIASVDLLIKYAPVIVKYVKSAYELGDIFVVSGLPIAFKDYADVYRQKIKEVKGVIDVVVVPQAAGVLEDVKPKVSVYRNGLIVDIGFNTVDYLAYRFEAGKVIKERAGTIEALGVRSCVNTFRVHLPSELSYLKNYPLAYLIEIFRQGSVSVGGQVYNLNELKQKVLSLWSEQIYSRLSEELGFLLKDREVVVSAGGGAYLLDRNVFQREVIVPIRPEFANARGYYKVGQAVVKV